MPGTINFPLYTEDLLYAAYYDRLLIKSLGVQAGVVESEDYKVSAGAGLQVNIKSGKAFVAETKAIEELENAFYNGLYLCPNPAETNPYNSVEVSAANPQIAQIILRVYDVGELKVGGSSYARLEWLNGTPTASATKAKMEEGKYEGVAELPQSSFRIARVLVPKNATTSSEYYIEDARLRSNQSQSLINNQSAIIAGTTSVKSFIATEQERNSATYGTLATPDEVTVVMPENGLIAVAYQATWKASAGIGNGGRAAIFIGANQLKVVTGAEATAPETQQAEVGGNAFASLASFGGGLASTATGVYTGDVTTGQAVGAAGKFLFVLVQAAAGAYSISVQYKAVTGTVTAKSRKLWAWVIA